MAPGFRWLAGTNFVVRSSKRTLGSKFFLKMFLLNSVPHFSLLMCSSSAAPLLGSAYTHRHETSLPSPARQVDWRV
jgi:hypothetical protein